MKQRHHRCGGCGRKLPDDHERPYFCSPACRDRSRQVKREHAKRAYAANPQKYRGIAKQFRLKNPGAAKAGQKRWREANREAIAAQRKAWAASNRDKLVAGWRRWVAANPEKNRAKVKAWQQANPERYKAQCHAKRVRDRTAAGNYTPAQWRARLEQCNYACAYCGSGWNLSVDHLIAVSRGGTNDIENIVPACIRCNSSKKESDVFEWLERMQREGMVLASFARELLQLRSAA